MKALVTGATGFLGGHLVERLIFHGYEVRAMARETSDITHLKTTGAEIVYADVADYDSLVPAVEGIDLVFHAAARVMPGWGTWEDYEEAIIKGTENVLKASAQANVKRFVYISSGSVLGKAVLADIPPNEETPSELGPLSLDTYYDYAKLQGEMMALNYHREGKVSVTVVRPCMIYGPRDRLVAERAYRHLVHRFVMWPGKANPKAALVYASDVADCSILAATTERAAGQIYNISPPEVIWFREQFGTAMIKAQGGWRVAITIPYMLAYGWCAIIEMIAKLRRQKDMPYLTRSSARFLNEGLYVDGTKAKKELGWEPKVSVDEGTRLYVEWRREQEAKPKGK